MRVKYHAKKVKDCQWCHNTHDSKMEAKECQRLHLIMREDTFEVIYIDVFPVVTLPGGERWKLDFCIYTGLGDDITPIFVDVKGFETPEYKRKRKIFDKFHPARPLRVVKYKGKTRIVEGNEE